MSTRTLGKRLGLNTVNTDIFFNLIKYNLYWQHKPNFSKFIAVNLYVFWGIFSTDFSYCHVQNLYAEGVYDKFGPF